MLFNDKITTKKKLRIKRKNLNGSAPLRKTCLF
jgi:hypothetical protein